MNRRQQVVTTLALISLASIVPAPIASVHAQEVLKVGIIGQFTGPFAVTGEPEEIPAKMLDRYGDVVDRISFYAPYKSDRERWARVVEGFKAAS